MSEAEYTEGDFEPCYHCHGEGGWHDCFDDTCCCLDKDEITDICGVCKGSGELFIPYPN